MKLPLQGRTFKKTLKKWPPKKPNDNDADDMKKRKIVSKPIGSGKKLQKNWIAGAIKHPGALHRQMGIKQGTKIPAGRLASATHKPGVEGRRARLAETLRGLHKKAEPSRAKNRGK